MNSKLDIIKILNNGNVISGQEIAKKLGVSRNMVWKNINSLILDGFNISSSAKGYKLLSFPNEISKEEILINLETDFDIIIFDSISSTNDYAKQNVSSFKKNTIIIAKEQTCGKGRFNRKFYSNRGGLYLTFIFKESLDISYASLITLFTAVAVSKAIEKTCGISCEIKWVNDIFINGKKLCGILSEASISCEQKIIYDYIIGIGINVENSLDKQICEIATNLLKETQKSTNKSILCAEIIKNMQNLTSEITTSNYLTEYKNRLFILGKNVIIDGQEGKVLALNDNGSLQVEINGENRTFYAGDVSIKL